MINTRNIFMELGQWEHDVNAKVVLNLIAEQPEPHRRAAKQGI